MKSLWYENWDNSLEKHSLPDDVHTEVLIVGGGMAGILCAYQLQKRGIRCLLVEKNRITGGNTGHTTAKITAQHGAVYDQLITRLGAERARQYYDVNTAALAEYRKMAEEIPCNLEKQTAYLYSPDRYQDLEREAAAYERLSIDFTWQDQTPLPLSGCRALGVADQAQFHPLKFIWGILPQIDYCENTEVVAIEGNKAYTEDTVITAENIILATHYPLVNVPGLYFMKLVQHRSYVSALEGADPVRGMYIGLGDQPFSFRDYKDLLLVGGGGHKTGQSEGGFCRLREFTETAYPHAQERYRWAAQDCMSLDGIPYIGQHRFGSGNLYVATGFNKWGMTGSMAASLVLADLIVSGRSRYAGLFAPNRMMAVGPLLRNMGSAAVHLLTPGKRCSHLGCRLSWNEEEKSWDCTCHGSRFANDGKVLDNPAKREIMNEK